MDVNSHKLTCPAVLLHLNLLCLRAYDVPVVSGVCASFSSLTPVVGKITWNYPYRPHDRGAVQKQLSGHIPTRRHASHRVSAVILHRRSLRGTSSVVTKQRRIHRHAVKSRQCNAMHFIFNRAGTTHSRQWQEYVESEIRTQGEERNKAERKLTKQEKKNKANRKPWKWCKSKLKTREVNRWNGIALPSQLVVIRCSISLS